MGHVCIINAPLGFSTVWSAIKPMLAKETVAKIEILGKGYEDTLLGLVDADALPADFGGTCECPGGCQTSNAGPWLEGRAARRAAWLARERPGIALTPEDVGKAPADDSVGEDASKHGPGDEVFRPEHIDLPTPHAETGAPILDGALVATPRAEAPTPVQSPPPEEAFHPDGVASLDARGRQGGVQIVASSARSARSASRASRRSRSRSVSRPPGDGPPSGMVSPTGTHRSHKSRKSISSIFSGKSRDSSVDPGSPTSPRKSRMKDTVDKVIEKLKLS
jgi:hypothetical protein